LLTVTFPKNEAAAGQELLVFNFLALGRLHNWSDKLLQEARNIEEGEPEVVDEVVRMSYW